MGKTIHPPLTPIALRRALCLPQSHFRIAVTAIAVAAIAVTAIAGKLLTCEVQLMVGVRGSLELRYSKGSEPLL